MVAVVLSSLPDDVMVIVLEFLRAMDLATASESNNSIFSKFRISRAIRFQLNSVYNIFSTSSSPAKLIAADNLVECRCDVLYVREVKTIIAAITHPSPLSGKGYWVSSSWLSNAKKYFEALNLPELCSSPAKKSGSRRQSKIRQRRGSDALPPWPTINADLVCSHGQLSLAKVPTAKRKIVCSKVWCFLRKFYSSGPEFKSSTVDCPACVFEDTEAKTISTEKRETVLSLRKIALVPDTLGALLVRKCGYPSALSTRPREAFPQCSSPAPTSPSDSVSSSPVFGGGNMDMHFANSLFSASSSSGYDSGAASSFEELPSPYLQQYASMSPWSLPVDVAPVQPLLPGLYHIVSKSWLKSWRQYSRDPNISTLPPMDCTTFLCQAHGDLVVPPHVQDYLLGARRSLLNGLGMYPGEVAEILSLAEWDTLQDGLGSHSEFGVCFSLDGDNVTWSSDVCHTCDPFNYNDLLKKKAVQRYMRLP